jgi:hypothetical protein
MWYTDSISWGWPGKSVSWTALPPAVTLITDTTLSVGLPSLSASTQVPANFFICTLRPATGVA